MHSEITQDVGDEVLIGDPAHPLGVVRVVEIIHGNRVRLAFDFPREVPITRRELVELKLPPAESASGADGQPKAQPAEEAGGPPPIGSSHP